MREGLPHPRGATWDGRGVNFALFSAHATRVELCLFDGAGEREVERLDAAGVHRRDLARLRADGVGPGTVYGYRVHGPTSPTAGHRFNPNKLLLDPYARAHIGELKWDPACFGYTIGADGDDLTFDERDSAPFVPKCVVVDPDFDWSGEPSRRPRAVGSTRSSTRRTCAASPSCIPAVAEQQRGTSPASAHAQVIDYIKSLGVTSVELLPVHTFINDSHLLEQGAHQLLGLQHASASSRPIRATRRSRATACANSRRWSRASTTPGSR